MKFRCLIKIFLIILSSGWVHAQDLAPQAITSINKSDDVSYRFHAQWNVDEGTRKKIEKAYGDKRIRFDQHGHPIAQGLSKAEVVRWERLYKLCMSDGCLYCDHDDVGSCESLTCGPNNAHCKPHLGHDGRPLCGEVCADYAFKSLLTYNDPS
ncbi:MAG: hypothetical protein H0X26_05635 [Alphaproteobacteria bacterium]|nr:hypothetical protein [Alphaproteobacteria bacterium]